MVPSDLLSSYAYSWCVGEYLSCDAALTDVDSTSFERHDPLQECQAYTVNVSAQTEAGLGPGNAIHVFTAVEGKMIKTSTLISQGTNF